MIGKRAFREKGSLFCFFEILRSVRRLFESRRGFLCLQASSILAKALALSACRSWWLKLRHSTKSVYMISLVPLCRAAKQGRSRRERPGSLSFAISLWNDKEMASMPAQRTRAEHSVSVKRRRCLKFSFLSFVRRTTRGGRFMLLLGIPQEVAKKGTKGPEAPWHPAVRHGKMNFA